MTEIVVDDPTHGPIPATTLRPSSGEGLPYCAFLYGGGGTRSNLAEIAALFETGFADGTIAPMVLACLEVPPWGFYLEDPIRGWAWETAVGTSMLQSVRKSLRVTGPAGLVGISMGGYGALKIAFSRPETYAAVAAVAPMIEPASEADATPVRNRFHYPPECPAELVGPTRDAALYRDNHPVHRARSHANAIAAHQQAIYLDAGSQDTLNAHDGAEFLHRVLWDLDLRHEYHRHRDADHVGPTLLPRLRAAFAWVGERLHRGAPTASPDEEHLRTALAPARERALAKDPDVARTYGLLPTV